jgi:CRISPR type I-E-associated protein CasB/Cse2
MTELVVQEGMPSTASLVSTVAGLLAQSPALTQGDLSALRRMDPRRPDAAFFKIEGLVLDDWLPGDAAARADLETRWAAVACGLAHLGELHRPGLRLGTVLAEHEWSELRFVRLVRADVGRLADDLPTLARFLKAKSAPVDWSGAAHLILSAGTPWEEEVRRHIARDYYGSLARRTRQNQGAK